MFFVAGCAELVAQRDNPTALLVFWLPALWGGAVLILCGVFLAKREGLSVALVGVGAAASTLATAWTIVMPLLNATLVALVVFRNRREPAPTT